MASAALRGVRGELDKTQQAALATGAALTGLAAGGALVLADMGKAAADFEHAMSQVYAVMSPEQLAGSRDALRDYALVLGRDTVYSAREAASGLEELVKAGVQVNEVLGGAGRATLDLAAAGGVQIAEAATIAANSMNAFGRSGAEMAHIAGIIAGAANASAIDVHQFGYSLEQAGAVAHIAGLSFEDTATAIALMGNAGIKGSDAGTSLKVFLQNLIPQSAQAAAKMRELGIITADGANQFFDASGKVKSYAEIAGILQGALAGLTAEQQLQALHTAFGTDAMRAAAVAMQAGAAGVRELYGEMTQVTAMDVARERLNNLEGDVKLLTSSWETFKISFGSNLAPGLRPLVQDATQVVNALAALPPEAMQSAAALASVATVVTGATGVFLTFAAILPSIQAGLTAMGLTLTGVLGPVGLVAAAVSALALAWVNDWGNIREHTSEAADRIGTDLAGVEASLTQLGSTAATTVTQLGDLASKLGAALSRTPEGAAVGGCWQQYGEQVGTVLGTAIKTSTLLALGPFGPALEQFLHDKGEEAKAAAAEEGRRIGADFVENAATAAAAAAPQGASLFGVAAETLVKEFEGRGFSPDAAREAAALYMDQMVAALESKRPDLAGAGLDLSDAIATGLDAGRPHVINASERIASEVGASLQSAKGNVEAAVADILTAEAALGHGADSPSAQQAVAQILQRANALNTPSHLKRWVEMLELDPGIGRGEAPVDPLAGGVAGGDPGRDFLLDRRAVS